MKLTSASFTDGESIPQEYTMYGQNRIPTLNIEQVPENARTLALIVDDPDAPKGTFTHWVMFNIDSRTRNIGEGNIPKGSQQGENDFGKTTYGGPKPPSGEHRYFFKLYALDSELPLSNGIHRNELESAMKSHVLDSATLMGRFAH